MIAMKLSEKLKKMSKAQTIKATEIEAGKALIARYSLPENANKPGARRIAEFNEKIVYLESLSDEQIEKAENFLQGTITGATFNYESLVSFIEKN
jgi:hypothetical protein